jgi:hypothetical protein
MMPSALDLTTNYDITEPNGLFVSAIQPGEANPSGQTTHDMRPANIFARINLKTLPPLP